LAWVDGTLVVIQDDACFLGLVRPDGTIGSVALPPGSGGARRFEERTGNRLRKPDFEACVRVDSKEGSRLLVFGSGSLRERETLLVIEPIGFRTELVDAHAFYEEVRSRLGTRELNLEGAVLAARALRLFDRGNGVGAIPSTVDLDLSPFLAWLEMPAGAVPGIERVDRYDLGGDGTVRYGFTDAARLSPDRVLYLAAAERSKDAIEDGEVLGSRIGWIENRRAAWTTLEDPRGPIKAEGLAVDPSRSDRAWITLDPDDPDQPADLCEVELQGNWRGM
jgi:hypothetical protein